MTRRRRSANSAWWKFDSPNQRSTRAGTARASSAARSAAASVSARAASWSNVVAADGLAGLDDDDRRLRARGDGLGQRPEQVASRRPSPPGAADAPMTTRSARSASRRMALRTFGRLAQERLAATLQVLLDERGERALGLGPDGQRDARRDEVEDDDGRVVVAGDRVGEPDRQLGVRPAADRDEDPLDLA